MARLTGMELRVEFVRERYLQLNTDSRKHGIKFTAEEDMKIMKAVLQYGYDWARMESEFKSRDSLSIKNRFYSHIKKNNLMEDLAKDFQTK